MKKALLAAAAAGSMFIPTDSQELRAQDLYEQAAHIPATDCKEEVTLALGNFVSEAVFIDRSQAIAADRKTQSENNKRATPDEVSSYPTIEKYIDDNVELLNEYELPAIGLTYALKSNVSGWRLHPLVMEDVLQHVLSTKNESNPLQSEAYQCYKRQIFESNMMAGTDRDLVIIGNGNNCIARDRIAQIGNGVCTAGGRHSNKRGRLLLTPSDINIPAYQTASSSLMHEFAHLMLTVLDTEPGAPNANKKEEAVTYAFEEIAFDYMRQTGKWVLTYDYEIIPANH